MKTREQHKQELLDQLLQCDYARLIEIRSRAIRTIKHNEQCFATQNENGMGIPLSQLEKNNARAKLELECVNKVLDDAANSYGDQ